MAGIPRSWSMGDNFWLRNYYFGLLRKERRFTVDGREVFASANLEAGENYVVMDDTGRFVRLRKPDVAMVLK